MKLLLRMKHGMGDNAQFTIVLRHIRHFHPDWTIDLEAGSGKESYFYGRVNAVFRRKKDQYDISHYDNILDVRWPVPRTCSEVAPSTKPTEFLTSVLSMPLREDFYRSYDVTISPLEDERADEYARRIGRPFVLVHYMAKTLKGQKSLAHDQAAKITDHVRQRGLVPVVLDWKKQSPLPDQKTVFNPGPDDPVWGGGESTAGGIAALINRAAIYVGIDSGPLHVAGATSTPAIGLWHGHHPVNFFDLADNVHHLVPGDGANLIKGANPEGGRLYFERKYRYTYYSDLGRAALETIDNFLK